MSIPVLEKGDMWSVFGKTGNFIITTNPIVKNDGSCVMGAGIAKQFKRRHPDGPYLLGEEIKAHVRAGFPMDYGYFGTFDEQDVYYFMVKDHWAEEALPRRIRDSARKLKDSALLNPARRYDLNFPGIGNGRLKREDVLPLLEDLPDNVHIWEFE